MSVSSLPEWKQLLLEKKKREEVERGRREKEEEEKLASMPAWKRGIIQRRRAKQETWLDPEPKAASQVSLETIVPVHENPFIRTQSGWKKGRDGEPGTETEVKERDKMNPRGQDAETRSEAEVDAWREVAGSAEMFPAHSLGSEQGADTDPKYDSAFTESPGLSCTVAGRAPHRGPEWSGTGPQGPYLTVLSSQPEDLISKIEKIGDATVHLNEKAEKAHRQEPLTEGDCRSRGQDAGLRSPTRIPAFGTSQTPLTIQIPRTVFYVGEEMLDKTEAGGLGCKEQDWDAGRGIKRKDSWKIGKHLSRIESLQEKMRQKELEKMQQGGGGAEDGEEACDQEDRYWERGSETQKEQKAEAAEQRRPAEADVVQEETAEPSSMTPKQTITIVPSFLRNQSSENSLKPANCAPTPASSPSSLSPAQSPCPSPSPTPSPVLFSIKSASGGHVKRGATITVTPKKPTVPTAPTKPPPQQTSPATADPGRKKYPTVEEIEVIGGYQNLERSCLIKSRGTPKRGKVCFHEDQLEQVCEYPSETSMLSFNPLLHDGGKVDKPRAGEAQEEEGEAEAGLLKSTRSVGIAPRLRVGQCHPQLNKHKVEFLSRAKDSVVLRKPLRRELYSICGNVVQHLVF
uniref:Phostensin/Taperin PP1-binding domain-containing protein n=1 Tax=Oryzias latipes TaxID=8090 RepID=A0A3B3H5S0_ORYLA